MIHEPQDQFQQALAEYERIKERRIERLMAMFEENGFYCERGQNSRLTTLLIWPKKPTEVPLEGAAASDPLIDDVLTNLLEGHRPSDYLT